MAQPDFDPYTQLDPFDSYHRASWLYSCHSCTVLNPNSLHCSMHVAPVNAYKQVFPVFVCIFTANRSCDLFTGLLRRATGCTNMNAASSRSHALCTITLQTPAPPPIAASPCKYPSISQHAPTVYSKIQLVDLAGSERLSQALSKTTKETCQINRGLHALSNVIMALSTPHASTTPSPHVPYRDSKLTRVLQDSLGGSARTLMIACVSAADESVQESLSTLQYATRARRIQNRITATAPLEPPTDDSIVNLQWTLLRKHLSCVGLMPIPEVLMQVRKAKLLCTCSEYCLLLLPRQMCTRN